ncbi:MAG: segregation/condensation protein A [Oscillospiraceae bacterium]|nr:segregation/condensation protein A [Oscillospiraceae bacterium]
MEAPKYHLEGVVHTKAETPEDFDGPLDVILLLLSKNKIEIQDISISSILDQYLAYLRRWEQLDMEIASEFIAMASRLMYIKTKMLLSVSDQAEARSEMESLIRSLEERQRQEAYHQIQLACEVLSGRNEIGRGVFTKGPEPLRQDPEYAYRHDQEDLLRAMAVLAERGERALLPPESHFDGIVGAEPYPVAAKAAEVLKGLIRSGMAKFRSLFRGNKSRSEIVATFLAILELCKLRAVRVEGDEEPTVTYVKMPENAGEPS